MADIKPKECHICGCTEERACMTDTGPCSWAFEDQKGPVCSACIVELPPDAKRAYLPEANLIMRKLCTVCAHLVKGEPYLLKDSFTCDHGKFGVNQYFAWSGVKSPNKTVAKARRSCREWELHPEWDSRL